MRRPPAGCRAKNDAVGRQPASHWCGAAVRQALYGSLDGVFVPDMYEDITTQRVLIMEWVEGRRLRTGTSGAPPPPFALPTLPQHL